ncbi:MAG: DUF1801 domain-containing protein [Candidatus Eisenbacteria bacterium]
MAEIKTQRTEKSVSSFLDSVEHQGRREDAKKVAAIMEDVTGEKPEMWGESIIGFGSYHYVYESGREGDWMLVGFSPRKANLVLYIMSGFSKYDELMARLGKHKTGKSCLYLNRLSDVDEKVLRRLIKESVTHLRKQEKSRSRS